MLLIITDVAQDAGVGAAKSGNVSGDPLSPCLRLLPLPGLSQSLAPQNKAHVTRLTLFTSGQAQL